MYFPPKPNSSRRYNTPSSFQTDILQAFFISLVHARYIESFEAQQIPSVCSTIVPP